jgi:flavin-dependent thymidylate synthase
LKVEEFAMPLTVTLGGYNVDLQALEKRLAGAGEAEGGALSPETIAAAYARISRDPRHVSELRADSCREVERARKSNRTIIFDMGHASVSEHAVFNLDISGLSRLAVEALEHHRLASYTEKSQRYVRLEGAVVVPAEICAIGLEEQYRALIERLTAAYLTLATQLAEHTRGEASATTKRREIESRANEDARYVLPLGAETQLGMTANARTLELMIARFSSHALAEVRDLGEALHAATAAVAPSLIRYTEPTPYFRDTPAAVRAVAAELVPVASAASADRTVVLRDYTPDPDRTVAAALLFPHVPVPFVECVERTAAVSTSKLNHLFAAIYRSMEMWDALPRAFEMVNFTFELTVSAAAFAQLKRHRMATMLPQDYDPRLGRTMPQAVERAGATEQYRAHLDAAEELYQRIAVKAPAAAAYVLTNAHRRRVLMHLNARDLGHLGRLRCDHEAQWDIRALAEEMVGEARRVMPLAGAFYGGKDCVEELKQTFADW